MIAPKKCSRRYAASPRKGVWLAVALAAAMTACGSNNQDAEEIAQPIAFNHKAHTVTEEMTCDQCHKHYETHSASGLPTMEVCAECHTEGHSETAEGKKVDGMADAMTSVTWARMYMLPNFVVFDHSAHTADASITCETCHVKTGVSERPTRFRNFGNTGRWINFTERERTMNWCVNCHKERLASTDCLTCHQ